MRSMWTAVSVLLWACGGGQAAQPETAEQAGGQGAQASGGEQRAALGPPSAAESSSSAPQAAKSVATQGGPTCTPLPNAQPKTVTGENEASDVGESGQALVFEVAGISLELPACTPDADVRVTTVSWETKERPSPSRIHPQFTRHGATLRVDQAFTALEGSPLLVRLHSKRELTKPGEKLVLAVESGGECNEQNKRDQLESGECAHWTLFDASYDAQAHQMVARVPSTGGYRLQFGWVPSK